MPATSISGVLPKQETFLKMELAQIPVEDFDEAVAKPLNELDLIMCASVSAYRDLKRLTNSRQVNQPGN